MGLFGRLFTAVTAPVGSTAYVIKNKSGEFLRSVDIKKDGTFSTSWARGSLSKGILFWSSESEAKEFAVSHGLESFEIDWTQVSR